MNQELSKDRRRILIKLGGEGAEDREVIKKLSCQIKILHQQGYQVVVVHGGGKSLTEWATRCGVDSRFVEGRRVTDDSLIDLAQMVFVGRVGTRMMAWINASGVSCAAVSGVTDGLIIASKRPPQGGVDYGWVGDIKEVNPRILETLWAGGYVPLVASLGGDHQGNVYNINADTIACWLAQALGVEEILFLTKLPGVLARLEDLTSTVDHICISDVGGMIRQGQISAGMLPKLAAIEAALKGGVARVEMGSWEDLGDPAEGRKTRLTLWD
jgi:acetylglutamate kinase